MKSKTDLAKAIRCLQNGDVIITPSESCYGFSCSANNANAVAKINALKGRVNMPMTILVSNLAMLESFVKLDEISTALSRAFHPGPLNIITDFITADNHSYLSPNGLAFRIPKSKTLLDLITAFDAPITTTSANRHGEPAIYAIDEIKAKFGDDVCAILDDGDLNETNAPSTVYDARSSKLIRTGPISLQQIEESLKYS